jgi:hypothetical protein
MKKRQLSKLNNIWILILWLHPTGKLAMGYLASAIRLAASPAGPVSRLVSPEAATWALATLIIITPTKRLTLVVKFNEHMNTNLGKEKTVDEKQSI